RRHDRGAEATGRGRRHDRRPEARAACPRRRRCRGGNRVTTNSNTLRRATIKEVAEAAGVSRSTASRALSGTGYVAENVRSRVRQAAKELGYVVDATARSLKQQSSRLIGVLVSDLRNA